MRCFSSETRQLHEVLPARSRAFRFVRCWVSAVPPSAPPPRPSPPPLPPAPPPASLPLQAFCTPGSRFGSFTARCICAAARSSRPRLIHVAGKVMGTTLWLWVFWRAKHDGGHLLVRLPPQSLHDVGSEHCSFACVQGEHPWHHHDDHGDSHHGTARFAPPPPPAAFPRALTRGPLQTTPHPTANINQAQFQQINHRKARGCSAPSTCFIACS
jgi:hypothetical protein